MTDTSFMAVASLAAFLTGPVHAEETDAAKIRAGHDVAATRCVSCHVIAPADAPRPVMDADIPTFEEIANRPSVTADALRAAMKSDRWHVYALPHTLLPMSTISDKEQDAVAVYIISLRKRP